MEKINVLLQTVCNQHGFSFRISQRGVSRVFVGDQIKNRYYYPAGLYDTYPVKISVPLEICFTPTGNIYQQSVDGSLTYPQRKKLSESEMISFINNYNWTKFK
jgi:hypothetical protein